MLKVGDPAPAFSLPSDSGKEVSLKDFRGKKVVLYFYPKDMTPGCTTEACDFQSNLKALAKKGAVVLGVSKDSVKSHGKFREKYGLEFPLLADENGETLEAYGVWPKKGFLGKSFLGIARTTFVIDEKGIISKIYENVQVANHVSEVLSAL